jgi:hypothetical protein
MWNSGSKALLTTYGLGPAAALSRWPAAARQASGKPSIFAYSSRKRSINFEKTLNDANDAST